MIGNTVSKALIAYGFRFSMDELLQIGIWLYRKTSSIC
jgi:hypothetical protein